MRISMQLIALLCAMILSACAPRGEMVFAKDTTGFHHELLVATTRKPIAGTMDFSRQRAAATSYASYTVSVPRSHETGQVEWPDENPDPASDFVMVDHRSIAQKTAFTNDVTKMLRARPAGEREVVIFVHGYNTNMAEGLYRFAQMQHDFESNAVPVLYSWPSAASTRDYIYDRDSILFARTGLEKLIDDVSLTPVDRIVLIGHSMGGQLVMESLRQRAIRRGALWPELKIVALISPDLSIDLFRAQAREIGSLPQPFVIFTSGGDTTLRLSEFVSGNMDKLGALDDLESLSDLNVTVIDTTALKGKGVNSHLSAVTSPWMISVLKGIQRDKSFALDRPDPGSFLPVQLIADDRSVGLVLNSF